ncbi:prolyl-oligopeptidase [Acetobacter aceti NRIC 0242]|uniref:Prolyl oligopeptidase n=1 Tax=Acetobacter aceti NBRC 14818 TaxID=887700 RepID=A0AB33ILK0_ACEAC|nr:prolyl oligopeptidase family serine peptidase [Acetobacter aceti]TCS29405.1 prolyl oligopeptidase [Acetobacter aceti NBRC 14818]BCK76534.1 prolyl oligopeptidase [Acetobacter aceti NBRC 14818]GAN57259.1 prolyl-oligopeptidase [Acetobacter aceti NBRC 14818]GBO82317.1 prolyl-oligopeptidase [Acetobacter aceti NRIC 0242]
MTARLFPREKSYFRSSDWGIGLAMTLSVLLTVSALAQQPEALPSGVPTYLDEIHGAQAQDWVERQNRKTVSVLEVDPRYRDFYDQILSAEQSKDRLDEPAFLGGNIWNFWQDGHHPRGIWRRTTLASYRQILTGWQTKLDIDALASREHENWVFEGADCLKPKERYCLVALSSGGEDARTLREYDTQAGLFVLNGFTLPRAKQSAAWVDRDTLLVTRDWDGTGAMLTSSGYPFVIRRVVRNEPFDQALEIYRGEKDDVAVDPLVVTDGDGNRIFLVRRSPEFFSSRFAVLEGMETAFQGRQKGTLRWLTLPDRVDLKGMIHGTLVFSLEEDWTPTDENKIPAGSLVALDPHDPQAKPEILFTPESGKVLEDAAVTRNTIIVTYLEHVQGRVMVLHASPDVNEHWHQVVLPLPDMSSVHIVDIDQSSDAAFLKVESFLSPPELWLVGASQAGVEKIRQTKPLFNANDLAVEQLQARSSDGAEIPYFLIRPRNMTRDGTHPTLLTAYGGFLASVTPRYDPVIGRAWLTHGGVYAVANIRGGGEFGPAWHEAGKTIHRQRIFDDFTAVGRDLVKRKITSRDRLGIRGRSNGGLLMGVAFTQHPELWKAVIMGVPLLDMINYESLAAGASWVDEYGSMKNPDEAHFLESISPLQHLKADVQYPTPFIFTSTSDDRVGPVHARRFAARLEALKKPFFYYEDVEGGHSGTVNAEEIAHERALEAVYLAQQLMSGQ